MSEINNNNNENNTYKTPDALVYGALLAFFGLMPVLYGLGEKSRGALIAGGVMIAVAAVMIVIGNAQKKRLLAQNGAPAEEKK